MLAFAPLVAAQSAAGSFVVYQFSLASDDAEYAGTWRQEIVRELADGRVELRIEVQTADTTFRFERNVTASSAQFPILPPIQGFELTLTRDYTNASVSIIEAGQQPVSFQGEEHLLNTTRYSLRALVGDPEDAQAIATSGVLQAFPSGLLYLVEGEYTLEGDETHVWSYRVVLDATNLPLIASAAATSALAFFPSFRNDALGTSDVAPTPGLRPEVIWAVGGAIAVVGAFVYLSLGRRRKPPIQDSPAGERPPHWVP
jgi:hypothetical protein